MSAAQMGWTAAGGVGAEGPTDPQSSADCTAPRVNSRSFPSGLAS